MDRGWERGHGRPGQEPGGATERLDGPAHMESTKEEGVETMKFQMRVPGKAWTVKQAIFLAVVCLTAGIAGGWAIRASLSPATGDSAKAGAVATGNAASPAPAASPAAASSPVPTKEAVDAQAAPQLEKLKSDPNNSVLLTGVGNLYYDAQQYSVAVDYYQRALKVKPSDAAVRTDMATAYWYMGNADLAIVEFNKALTYAPTNPNTLFNLGLVKWKGKKDSAGAIAD